MPPTLSTATTGSSGPLSARFPAQETTTSSAKKASLLRVDPEVANHIRKLALYCALGVVFVRFSLLHEGFTVWTGVNSRVLYFLAIPALLGVACTGGIRRAFSRRTIYYWAAFVIWMFLAVPFSVWRGESARIAFSYLRAEIPVILMLAGLPMLWKECRLVLYTIGMATVVSVLMGYLSGTSTRYGEGRAGLQFGTIANPNDFAAHLLLTLPILAFLIFRPWRFPMMQNVSRLMGLLCVAYGIYLVFASGSRGALLSVVLVSVFLFWKSRTPVRIALAAGLPLVAVALIALLPSHTIERLQSYSATVRDATDEAAQSTTIRAELLKDSIRAAITHPLFGVGTGAFAIYTGKGSAQVKWINAHNAYTQVASDIGIPGFLFYVCGIGSVFVLLRQNVKKVQGHPELKEIATASICIMAALIGYCCAIFFVNFAYFFYLPAIAGLVIAMHASVDLELERLQPVVKRTPLGGLMPALPVPPARTPVAAALATPRARNPIRFGGYR